MSYQRHQNFAIILCGLLAWMSAARVLAADAYTFEMIVFERPGVDAGEFWPETPGTPDRALATRSMSAGALATSARSLGPIAFSLKQRGMIIHKHLVWRETPGPRNSKRWRWLDAGRLSGLIRMTRGRFLHLDTDLLLREANSPRVYRVRLNRRMRSDELHYVDHPKLGIIVRARRVESAPASEGGDPAAGEPKPAAPAGQSG